MRIDVLGPLSVTNDAGEEVAIRLGHERAVLAALVCRRGAATSVSALKDVLWPVGPPRTATKNVQLYIHRLRRLLGASRISRRATGYEIFLAREELDCLRFRDLAKQGRELLEANRAAAATITLREALALWRGDAYEGLEHIPLLQPEINALTDRRLAALEERIDADQTLGRHHELVGELQALVLKYPLWERFRAQLMLALAVSGRRAEALAVYRQARRYLVEELGLEPGLELQRLEHAVLTTDGPYQLR